MLSPMSEVLTRAGAPARESRSVSTPRPRISSVSRKWRQASEWEAYWAATAGLFPAGETKVPAQPDEDVGSKTVKSLTKHGSSCHSRSI